MSTDNICMPHSQMLGRGMQHGTSLLTENRSSTPYTVAAVRDSMLLLCLQEAAIIKQVQNGKNAMPAWAVSHPCSLAPYSNIKIG